MRSVPGTVIKWFVKKPSKAVEEKVAEPVVEPNGDTLKRGMCVTSKTIRADKSRSPIFIVDSVEGDWVTIWELTPIEMRVRNASHTVKQDTLKEANCVKNKHGQLPALD